MMKYQRAFRNYTPIRNALIIVSALVLLAQAVSAQSITVNSARLKALADNENYQAHFVSGVKFVGPNGPIVNRKDRLKLGQLNHTLLSVTALRLADKGLIELDLPITRHLPELEIDSYFKRPLTAAHLLSQTSGLAVPPWYIKPYKIDAPFAELTLNDYIKSQRTPGQMVQVDPVGTLILALVLERIGKAPLEQVITTHLLQPMGLTAADFHLPDFKRGSYPKLFHKALSGEASKELLYALVQLIGRNRGTDKTPFFSPKTYSRFIGEPIFAHHPLSQFKTLGLSQYMLQDRIVYAAGEACESPLSLFTIPRHDLAVFIERTKGTACNSDHFKALLKTLSETDLPPLQTLSAQVQERYSLAAALREPLSGLSGIYVRDNAPTRWLGPRLNRLSSQQFAIDRTTDGNLLVTLSQQPPVTFEKTSAYAYRSAKGDHLLFTPFRLGGYAKLNADIYRYVGILGFTDFLLDPLVWCILLMLTPIVYIRSALGPAWRNMAKITTISTLLLAFGLFVEAYYAPLLYYHWGQGWLIVLSRIILNIGIMGVLAMPLFAMSFARNKKFPKGPSIIWVGAHMTITTAAALVLFLMTIAWGIAGEFSL